MDISTLVRGITSTLEDATALVNHIQNRKLQASSNGDLSSQNIDPAIQDLLESLELGPIVIRGYYASDAKRFGQTYIKGDDHAQEQLKDILLHLQLNVLTTLRVALVDNGAPDYTAIQSASHNCRVNAGVCLGQLSQRLADPNRVMKGSRHSATTLPIRIPTPALHYSADMSTGSSYGPITPTTSEMEAAFEFDYPGRTSGYNPRASNLTGKAFAILQGSDDPLPDKVPRSSHSGMEIWIEKQMAVDEVENHSRRPSSTCLSADDNPVFSPISPASSTSQCTPEWRVSPGVISRLGSITRKQTITSDNIVKDLFSPDDYLDTASSRSPIISSYRNVPSGSSLTIQSSQIPEAKSSPSIGGLSPPDQQTVTKPTTSRKRRSTTVSVAESETVPVPSVLSSDVYTNVAVDQIMPIVEEETPPVPRKSTARNFRPFPVVPVKPSVQKILDNIDPVLDTFLGLLNLPSEKDLLGYCKSAYRLQVGSEKKAFDSAQRPRGLSSMIQFWKCEKCFFEGPLTTISPPAGASGKNNKLEKIFDPVIREYDGIRLKWVFLAKCHVPTKSSALNTHKPDGSSGSFGCIFCTAEGSQRGWTMKDTSGKTASEDRPPTSKGRNKKGDSTPSVGANMPIFGNSHTFMEHLQMHRQRNYWPNKEMQTRMKCVVGRVAGRAEDFDINLLPFEGEL